MILQGYFIKFLLTTHFLRVLCASVFQNYWKHRGTENTEEGNCTEKITCQGEFREIALLGLAFVLKPLCEKKD
jgi:hypothetical protein